MSLTCITSPLGMENAVTCRSVVPYKEAEGGE